MSQQPAKPYYITRLQNQVRDLLEENQQLRQQLLHADDAPRHHHILTTLLDALGPDRRLGRLSPTAQRAYDTALDQLLQL